MPGHRSYCFTLNNPLFNELYSLLQQDFKYLIIGFEVAPTTGTKHIQGYIQFDQPKTVMSVKAILSSRAHVEFSKGTPQQNIAYCSKEGVWFEYGYKPTVGGRLTYEQVEEAMSNPRDNITIYRQYGKAFKEIQRKELLSSSSNTKFYRMLINNSTHKHMAIATDHLLSSIGIPITAMIIVSSVSELAAYQDEDLAEKTVVLLHPVIDNILPLYPKGVPIKVKHGYEYYEVKPKQLIVISQFAEILSHYKIYEREEQADDPEEI